MRQRHEYVSLPHAHLPLYPYRVRDGLPGDVVMRAAKHTATRGSLPVSTLGTSRNPYRKPARSLPLVTVLKALAAVAAVAFVLSFFL